ncbi:MAG: hypothetical protein ABIQ18_30140 [Umezawaea sp.]
MRIKAALLAVGIAVSGLVGLAGTANACTSADGGQYNVRCGTVYSF